MANTLYPGKPGVNTLALLSIGRALAYSTSFFDAYINYFIIRFPDFGTRQKNVRNYEVFSLSRTTAWHGDRDTLPLNLHLVRAWDRYSKFLFWVHQAWNWSK